MVQVDKPLDLLGGLTPNEFMKNYWQRKPLLVKGAFKDFQNPISPDELAGLSHQEEIGSVRCV